MRLTMSLGRWHQLVDGVSAGDEFCVEVKNEIDALNARIFGQSTLPLASEQSEAALVDAAGLCQSEARKWAGRDEKTAQHWEDVAIQLQSSSLVVGALRDQLSKETRFAEMLEAFMKATEEANRRISKEAFDRMSELMLTGNLVRPKP